MSGELVFVPLGGVGEIGMNVYLYGIDDQWIMVDLGLTFADDRLPGADLVLPDLSFIEERRDRLLGIIITHAHEDHIGAVPYLWSKLGVPIHCTRFPAAVLRRKLSENGVQQASAIREMTPGEPFDLGPFRCCLMHVTHSIPDANALAIDTPFGRVLHTGDWKLDPAPMVGERTDIEGLESFGRDGVLALVADSTNVMSPGTSGSEAEVRDSLKSLIREQKGCVVLTTFASNIARLETAMLAGHEAGRSVVVVGRSMHRMIDAAKESGFLENMPPVLDERDVGQTPREKLMYLVTGSQGEPRAALMRIAFGNHPRIRLEPGDTAIFSSKIIPGNERTLYNLHNQLVERGVEVITEEDHFVHVSGHPCRDEIEQMYRWMRPKIAVPVHGEVRHLYAHARLAERLGVDTAPVIRNGDMLRLAPGPVSVTGEVTTGRLVLETTELVDAGDDLYRTRRRLMSHGTIQIVLVLDSFGSLLTSPRITPVGAVELDTFTENADEITERISDAIEELSDREVLDDDRVELTVRTGLRQAMGLPKFKRPIIDVQIIRLSPDALDAGADKKKGAA
ncbi:MAG: ribonuclease J [Geminicoccaceae bacterium]